MLSFPFLRANFPQMNISQMHERLRLELLRRIQRGTASVSLLARQTGMTQAHISNFLNRRRRLSPEAMDRILAAQRLAAADLLSSESHAGHAPQSDRASSVPVVSHAAALFEPTIRPAAIELMLHLPATSLQSIRARPSTGARRTWQRFVAIRVPAVEARPMEPLVFPEAIALIDRHYTSLVPYRPHRPNLYAVRVGSQLTLRYVEFLSSRLVLRPHDQRFPVHLIEVDPGESPNELLVGRVVLVLSEL